MNRYSVLSIALASVAALGGVGSPTASAVPKPPVVSLPKPNIVHIMVDDLGWQDIASHKIDGKPIYGRHISTGSPKRGAVSQTT
jgi:hypothetical protein